MEENKVKVFIDHVGHTIVGEFQSETKNLLKVKNPAILIASPNNNGQLTVQLIPVFFKEFVKVENREAGISADYPLDKVVPLNVELDVRLLEQYVSMFKPTPKVESKEAPTIKLFDE